MHKKLVFGACTKKEVGIRELKAFDLEPFPRKIWQLVVREDRVEPKSRQLLPGPSYLGVAIKYKMHNGEYFSIHLDISAKVNQAMGRSQSSIVTSLPEMTRSKTCELHCLGENQLVLQQLPVRDKEKAVGTQVISFLLDVSE